MCQPSRGAAAVATDIEADAEVGLAAPARKINGLLGPRGARAADGVDARPARLVGRDLDDAVVAGGNVAEGVAVLEAQHGPRGAGTTAVSA